MKSFVALITLAITTPAAANSVTITGDGPVRVELDGKREPGVGLRSKANRWRMNVHKAAPGSVAEFVDVTEETRTTKWRLPVGRAPLDLDTTRFIPGHAYRVEIRSGRVLIAKSLVYLYPPKTSKIARVKFQASETNSTDDSGLSIAPKGAL